MQPIPLSKNSFLLVLQMKYPTVSVEELENKIDNSNQTTNPNLFEILVNGYWYQFFVYNIDGVDVYIEQLLPF